MSDPQNPLNDPGPPEYDPYEDQGECWRCGGEGFVFYCWDGCCLDAEIGCDDCTQPCDICNQPKPSKDADALRQILADALAKQKESAR